MNATVLKALTIFFLTVVVILAVCFAVKGVFILLLMLGMQHNLAMFITGLIIFASLVIAIITMATEEGYI